MIVDPLVALAVFALVAPEIATAQPARPRAEVTPVVETAPVKAGDTARDRKSVV